MSRDGLSPLEDGRSANYAVVLRFDNMGAIKCPQPGVLHSNSITARRSSGSVGAACARRQPAQLVYGEWLRPEKRRMDAREQLRDAHAKFTDMGMDAFTERARRELVATGITLRPRTAGTPDALTTRRRRSPNGRPTVSPTRRLAPSCSSARAASNGTCATR
jgi:hypothetical protein